MDRIITASSSDQLKKKSPKIEKPINEATWGGGGGRMIKRESDFMSVKSREKSPERNAKKSEEVQRKYLRSLRNVNYREKIRSLNEENRRIASSSLKSLIFLCF